MDGDGLAAHPLLSGGEHRLHVGADRLGGLERIRDRPSHGVEVVDHPWVAHLADADAGLAQRRGVSRRLVAEGVELRGMDHRRRQAVEARRAQRRDARIAAVEALRAVVVDVALDCPRG